MASRDASTRLSRLKSLTHIHIGGSFNSKLKQTGFLSDIKKSSKLIAKNPKRFLEEYCNRRERLEAEGANRASSRSCDPILDTDCSQLKSFITDLAQKPCFTAGKEPELQKKHEFMKRRSTILKLASSNLVDIDPADLEGLSRARQSRGSRSRESDSNGPTHHHQQTYDSAALEKVIESYIQQIKAKARDMGGILEWIQNDSKMSDLKLPYGLPKEDLKIPTSPETFAMRTGGNSLASFIESAVDNFLLLDGEYHAKIEQITGQIQANNRNLLPQGQGSERSESRSSSHSYSSLRLSSSASASSSSSSPWTLSETALLTYVITTLEEDSSPSTRLNLVQYKLTSLLFPDKSQASVINRKHCIKYKEMLEEKRCSVINDWVHDKLELAKKINYAWDQLNKKYVEYLEQRNVVSKQHELCGYWSTLVDKHRQEKCERVKQLQILTEPLRRRRQAELQEQARREAERRKSIHEHVAQFRQQKEKVKLRLSLIAELEMEMADELRIARSKINRVRVHCRRQERMEREKRRRDVEQARQAEQLARAAKLESIKKPVHMDYKPWNAISDTHASAVRRVETLQVMQDAHSEQQKMVKFFRESYSFSTENIMRDRRLRLEMKLRDAGLMESSYARQVLQAMQPKPKPHLRTQIKFEIEANNNNHVNEMRGR